MFKNITKTDAGSVVFNMNNFGGNFTLSELEFDIIQKRASKIQKQTYAWVSRLYANDNTLGGFILRCQVAGEEAGYIRKDIRNLKNLKKVIDKISDEGSLFISERLDFFIRSLQLIHDDYAARTELVWNMH